MNHSDDQNSSSEILSSSIFSDTFLPYSDLYFKHNQTLPNAVVSLSKFIQSDNLLLSNDSLICSSNFVPFYQEVPKYCIGILDSKHGHLSYKELKCSYDPSSYDAYVPIFLSLPTNNHFKSFTNNYISRRTMGLSKKRRPTVQNLDEIIPMMDEMYRNIEHSPRQHEPEPYLERNVLLLDPLLLDLNERRTKLQISRSEHKKIVRITIMYVLAFFALALVTFFSLYLL